MFTCCPIPPKSPLPPIVPQTSVLSLYLQLLPSLLYSPFPSPAPPLSPPFPRLCLVREISGSQKRIMV